jgi:hypothetical protein
MKHEYPFSKEVTLRSVLRGHSAKKFFNKKHHLSSVRSRALDEAYFFKK